MEKKIQLFLLPFAGGNSFSFMRVIRFLDTSIQPITIEYSGRGSRKEEPFIEDYNQFLSDIVTHIKIKKNKNLPFAMLGYSMGSALTFDIVARCLLDSEPIHCFFCAEGSPIRENSAKQLTSLGTEEFAENILLMGGIDKRLKADSEAFNSNLEVIYRDHQILGQYRYNGRVCECDSTVIYSPEDLTCSDMDDWSQAIEGKIEYHKMGDNHFFINQCYRDIAEVINKRLIK